MGGEHFGLKFTLFVGNNTHFMTKGGQKLANSYKTYQKNTQNNYYVNKLVIKNNKNCSFVAFLNYLILAFLGKNVTLKSELGEHLGTFLNSACSLIRLSLA